MLKRSLDDGMSEVPTKKECPQLQPLNMMKVFVPDVAEGFVRAEVVDLGADWMEVLVDGNEERRRVGYDDAVAAAVEDSDVEDGCSLMYLNEGSLLHNCRRRYERKQIYTYVANILISMNPYEELEGLYDEKAIQSYRGKSLGSLPPHIYAIADKAFREMKRNSESQSIIVSGESGAGKTESQKYILRYLCANSAANSKVESRILDTNPILEAFGNAKTFRNNNSSRFGKFVEVHFGKENEVVGGHVSHYLLETARLCSRQTAERNFHIFFQMIGGADEDTAAHWALDNADSFSYLNGSCTQFFGDKASIPCDRWSEQTVESGFLADVVLDDAADYRRLVAALADVGFDEAARERIFGTLAGILHLGNVMFEGSPSGHGSRVADSSLGSLAKAAELFGLETEKLRLSLTSRLMQPRRGIADGTIIQIQLKCSDAVKTRDSLARALYGRLFDHIVSAINSSIPFGNSAHFIGVLDIAGFEFFNENSLEQLCINYSNEKLQNFFNERILHNEQELYKAEGLNVPYIEYTNNNECIELFEKKSGIWDLLDDEMRGPEPSSAHFTTALQQRNTNKRLAVPLAFREHRHYRDTEAFVVRHYAAAVCYQSADFVAKNGGDSLHTSLEALLGTATNSLITQLFPPEKPKANLAVKRLQQSTTASKFRSQLQSLLDKLSTTGTHFVRCIKPNHKMIAGVFNGAQILDQLRCAGMDSVLRLMQFGYPSRTAFNQLYEMYSPFLSTRMSRLDPRLFAECLFRSIGLAATDFAFGVTKVFFRVGKFAEFDRLLRADPTETSALIERTQSWLCRIRWQKLQFAVLSLVKLNDLIAERREAVTVIQSAIRSFLCRRDLAPLFEELRSRKVEKEDQMEENVVETVKVETAQIEEKPEIRIAELSYAQIRTAINTATGKQKNPKQNIQIQNLWLHIAQNSIADSKVTKCGKKLTLKISELTENHFSKKE